MFVDALTGEIVGVKVFLVRVFQLIDSRQDSVEPFEPIRQVYHHCVVEGKACAEAEAVSARGERLGGDIDLCFLQSRPVLCAVDGLYCVVVGGPAEVAWRRFRGDLQLVAVKVHEFAAGVAAQEVLSGTGMGIGLSIVITG